MNDDIILTREAIISGLNKIAEIITNEYGDFSICFTTAAPGGYFHFSTPVSARIILLDAAKTIEKEKPVKPEPIKGGPIFWMEKDKICGYKCPVCGDYIAKGDKHCDCGRELTWEGV